MNEAVEVFEKVANAFVCSAEHEYETGIGMERAYCQLWRGHNGNHMARTPWTVTWAADATKKGEAQG